MITPASYGNIDFNSDITVVDSKDRPTYTYYVNWENNTVGGYVNNIEAMQQAIYKILLTERFAQLIYSWNYGFEARLIVGRGTSIAESIVARLVREALLADGRILDVRDITTKMVDKKTLYINFTAMTVFGSIGVERRIEYGE